MSVWEIVAELVLLPAALFLAWSFVLTYATRSRWRTTDPGRAVMSLAAALAAVLTLICISIFVPDFPLRPVLRCLIYGSIAAALLQLNVALLRAQSRTSRPTRRHQ